MHEEDARSKAIAFSPSLRRRRTVCSKAVVISVAPEDIFHTAAAARRDRYVDMRRHIGVAAAHEPGNRLEQAESPRITRHENLVERPRFRPEMVMAASPQACIRRRVV
jgi:hypothetical protein